MKHYIGRLVGAMCWRVDVLGATKASREPIVLGALHTYKELLDHSPDGFSWGYGGSGPSQLALALLVDVLEDAERAKRLCSRFAQETTYKFEGNKPWILSEQQIRRVADRLDSTLYKLSPVFNTAELNLSPK